MASFYRSIAIVRACEQYLRENRGTQGQVEDFIFHLSMAAAIALTRKNAPDAKDLAALVELPRPELLAELLAIVRDAFAVTVREIREVQFDKLAKDPRSTHAVRERMTRYLASSRRQPR